MDFKEKPTKETIRIKNQKISVSVLVAFGKDGEHFVEVSPTISVSGYGTTAEEAKESFTAQSVGVYERYYGNATITKRYLFR